MVKRKPGRGQLSTLDTLPDWAESAKIEAYDALKERQLTQEQILDDFNTALRQAARAAGVTENVPQISRSAFNRAALRLSILGRRLAETREIAAVLAPKLDQAADNSVTLMVAETIKTLISEMLANAGELPADSESAEMLLNTARALTSAEQAKRISAETRKKIEADMRDRASKAVDRVAADAGLSSDQVAKIRRDVLGVRS